MASGVKVSKLNFELNPRGNLWFNDETTFGHKLLSKMGWSKGKGLGKNEDGIKENIKISKKESNSGVGWKHDEVPVAVGCLEYEDILQNLQKHFKSNQEKSVVADCGFEKSLEQRSRTARNHLHYQKFVRVKDLNRYSEKDMKSIFLEKPQKPAREHPSFHPNQTSTFNSQLSVGDYFALKMQKRKEETMISEVSTENNVLTLSQPIHESKKRKFVSENPESAASKKAKLEEKSMSDEMSSTEDNSKKSESKKSGKSRKKGKKLKKNKLRNLKSCLKGRTDYDLEGTRNVSFNEQVTYKILDTSLELQEEINDLAESTMDEETVVEPEFENVLEFENELELEIQPELEIETESETEHKLENEVSTDGGGKVGDVTHENESGSEEPQCLDLPKCSGSNFNFWLESQRQASKMKLYKEMMKKIKKNKILRSTNLLDIKGYGNWGL